MSILRSVAVFSLISFSTCQAQVLGVDSASVARALKRYYNAQQAQVRREYFYTLYHNHKFLNLNVSDSTLISRFLSRPNGYADQYSHVFTGYEGLKSVEPRKDSLLIHGYVPSSSFLRFANEVRERIYFSPVVKSQGSYRSTYNRPVYDGAGGMGTRKNIPYYMQTNRYDYLYQIRQNERSEK